MPCQANFLVMHGKTETVIQLISWSIINLNYLSANESAGLSELTQSIRSDEELTL